MPFPKPLLLLVIAYALILPSQAQQRHEGAMQRAPANRGGLHAPEVFRGGPRSPMAWGEFHHDTAPTRIAPHRMLGTNLPRANSWRGDAHKYDLRSWQSGGWRHETHNGRFGWWWNVGPDWYFFDQPVYPYPDLYTPLGMPIGWWYWCDAYQDYYPYVTYCPVPWESVLPRE